MLDLTRCDAAQLSLVHRVTSEIVALNLGIDPPDLMVVGASCRDVLQSALGHEFNLRATQDVDVALALSGWGVFERLTRQLTPINGNGIRYLVASVPVDLMPFGQVEDPTGTVTPRPRNERMSVWAFNEVFEHSLALHLGAGLDVRLPTVPGYAALKLCAWLDRAEYAEYKDAADIATTIYWYSESEAVQQRLYETELGVEILTEFEMDVLLASSCLLGKDIAHTIGPERLVELHARWPGNRSQVLFREMTIPDADGWPRSLQRRQAIVRALEAGLLSL